MKPRPEDRPDGETGDSYSTISYVAFTPSDPQGEGILRALTSLFDGRCDLYGAECEMKDAKAAATITKVLPQCVD